MRVEGGVRLEIPSGREVERAQTSRKARAYKTRVEAPEVLGFP